ncbi:MAG: hypothetical protein AB1646_00480 [Thermodesulfobacteriota bacterium]
MISVRLIFLSLLVIGPLSFPGICMAAESCAPTQWRLSSEGFVSPPSRPCEGTVQGGPPFINACHNNIRMDAMDVTIRLKQFTYVVDAEYRFYNTGTTRTEELVSVKCVRRRGMVCDFIRFELWVNGGKTDFREEKELPTRSCEPEPSPEPEARLYDRWRFIVGDVTFLGNAPTTVRARYEAYYTGFGMEGRTGYYASNEQDARTGLVGRVSFMTDSNLVEETRRELPKEVSLHWVTQREDLLHVLKFGEIGLIKCPSFVMLNADYSLHLRRPCSPCEANRGDLR